VAAFAPPVPVAAAPSFWARSMGAPRPSARISPVVGSKMTQRSPTTVSWTLEAEKALLGSA